ncbi:HlyD family secretion protein, partial [Rhizobiales bacterium L72]|nr:HlyD family secretion protein [Propylenella binzhouense]
MKRGRLLALLVALLAAGAAAWWLYGRAPDAPGGFQGYIEGDILYVAPEEGGRIEAMAVEAGDEARKGELLFALDTAVQNAQRTEAVARLHQAEAQLANLRAAQQRPEQIAVLKAQLDRANAALELSQSDYDRKKALFDRGFSSRAQLDQARAELESDRAALSEIEKEIDAARLGGRTDEIEAAEAAVRAAQASLAQAETMLARRRVPAP